MVRVFRNIYFGFSTFLGSAKSAAIPLAFFCGSTAYQNLIEISNLCDRPEKRKRIIEDDCANCY